MKETYNPFISGFEKKAFLGTIVGAPIKAVGRRIVKHPLKTLGTVATVGFAGTEIGSAMSRTSNAVGSPEVSETPPLAGPTF